MAVERRENPKETITILVRRDIVETEYERVKDKPDIRERSLTIEAQYLIHKQLIEKSELTLTATKNNDGIVTLFIDDVAIELKSGSLNEYSFQHVISCLYPPCQMGRGEPLVREMLAGQPLKVEVREVEPSESAIKLVSGFD